MNNRIKRHFINSQTTKASSANLNERAKAQHNRYVLSRETIRAIYNYFHFDFAKVEKAHHQDFKNIVEEIDYYFGIYNVHYREVKLTPKWSRDAFGPMIATFKGTQQTVALIPNKRGHGYHYFDPKTGFYRLVETFNERLFDQKAYLLYRPFENKKITFKDFFKFIFADITRLEMIGYILITIIASAFALVLPHLTKWIFTEIEIAPNLTALYAFIIFITGFMLISLLFTCYKLFISNRIRLKSRTSLQAAAIGRLTSLPSDFFKTHSAGDLTNRLNYLSKTAEILLDSLSVTTISLVFALIYLVQIFIFNTKLAIIGIAIALLTIGFDIAVILYAERNIRSRIEIDTKESGMSYATIAGIEKIKIAGAEKIMYNRWFNLFKQSAILTYNPPFIIRIRGVINSLISLVGYLLLYIFAINYKIEITDYYAFSAIYAMAASALIVFNNVTIDIARIRPYYEMASPLLETLPESRSGQRYITKLMGEIKLDHISFQYEKNGPIIIDDLSLHIKPGQEIAIVGETGCGKSTIIRLLLGFIKPQKGTIYYDKYDISELELKSLRHLIGTVMQDTRLFAGDIYSNIVVGAPWRNIDDAWRASKIASFDKDIKAMPMGMKTIIQEGDGGISGGQRQRLAIARAVINQPKILIFDEATSALDNITQKKISNAIKKLKCTRIIIAHRLSTVMHADQIYVLKNGKIYEHGTYHELAKKKGEFSKLMTRQKL